MLFFSILCLFVVLCFVAAYLLVRKKNMHLWLPHYIKTKLKGKPKYDGPTHIMFCFVDHYEPQWAKPNSIEIERRRVDRWHQEYPSAFGLY